jgi:hypothetical protein
MHHFDFDFDFGFVEPFFSLPKKKLKKKQRMKISFILS